jgi:PKD repeat protein
MSRRSLPVSLLLAAIAATSLSLAVSGAEPPPLPSSMAAVGDSISQAVSSGGTLGAVYPANAWSTGTNTTVNSHYARLLVLNPAIAGRAFNDSVSGAKMADLAGQMGVAAGQRPDYLTVLVGGNDLCTDTVAQMTSVTDFGAKFRTAMDTLTAGSPQTRVYVASIPRVYQLWELFRSSFWARTVWSLGGICQSLLVNPTSTQAADVARRAQVAQRNVEYNATLAAICAEYATCRFDGNAVYDVVFAKSDVAGDYFHPSIAGQAKLAAVSWAAGYWPNGGPTPDAPPTASFTTSCTGLACTFSASGSTDDHGIVAYAWTYGDGASGSGVTASHTFAASGTYPVTLVVRDAAGQTGTTTQNVTVTSADLPAVHLADATGSAELRKSGWVAKVEVAAQDSSAQAVGGATVTGAWSTGATGTCVTAPVTGLCSFSLNVSRKAPSVTWRVTGITAVGHTYDAAADVEMPVTIVAPI